MRRRELINRLKEKQSRLKAVSASGFSNLSVEVSQQKSESRLRLLHELEILLPEIIEKMEQS